MTFFVAGVITRHPDAAPVKLEQFDLLFALLLAQDQPDRRPLPRLDFVLLQPPEIVLKLRFFDVCGLKGGASSFLRIWAK